MKKILKNKGILKNKQNLKNMNGITLVALIITVILMLILAGVAISAVIDGDGLFRKSREATHEYKNAAKDENKTISNLMNYLETYLHKVENDIEDEVVDENPVVKPIATVGVLMTENQTYDGRLKGTYNNPIIPKGFAPINENEAIWGNDDGYKKGLVITDAYENGNSTGNEFVWIPIPGNQDGSNIKFERFNFNKGGVTYSTCGESMSQDVITSVRENEGFYIARYEAGVAINMTKLTSDSTANYGGGTNKPVSKAGAYVWNYIKWGTNNDGGNPGNGAVTVANSMYPKSDTTFGVTSTLIYAAQWDTVLNFIQAYDIGEAGYSTYATVSNGMGNHISGDSIEITTEPTTCGKLEAFKQKNIYDMAGNVSEWTLEEDYSSNNRIFRGGCYNQDGNDVSAGYRGAHMNQYINLSDPRVGFRVALYIK